MRTRPAVTPPKGVTAKTPAVEYIDLLAGIITRLRSDIAIARIASSVPPSFTDAPWGLLRHDELVRRLALRLEEMAP